jgi:Na+/H+ antiporter NhaA
MKTGTLLAIILFTLVAIGHLLRLIDGTEVVARGYVVPQWASVVGVVVPALIAWLLWKESK